MQVTLPMVPSDRLRRLGSLPEVPSSTPSVKTEQVLPDLFSSSLWMPASKCSATPKCNSYLTRRYRRCAFMAVIRASVACCQCTAHRSSLPVLTPESRLLCIACISRPINNVSSTNDLWQHNEMHICLYWFVAHRAKNTRYFADDFCSRLFSFTGCEWKDFLKLRSSIPITGDSWYLSCSNCLGMQIMRWAKADGIIFPNKWKTGKHFPGVGMIIPPGQTRNP